MKPLFTLLLSLFTLAATAQVPQANVLSLQVYEGNCTLGSSVSPQLDGGFIIDISATSTDLGNIDSICTIRVDRTIFLKYSSDASVLEWTKCYAGNALDSSFGYMFSTPDNGYILGGTNNDYTYEFLIHKENAAGVILWSKIYGDSAEAILRSMIATADGGYIMAGTTDYTNVDFPIHYGSWMDDDIAVIKVDSNGNKVWSEVIGGTMEDAVASVLPAPGNGCYIVGTTSSNDYDCTGNHGGSSGTSDVYLVRLDENGNKLWHHDIGGTGGDAGFYAVANGRGGVVIAGGSNSTNGDVTVSPPFGCPIWALEVDSNDNILWDNCYGGGGGDCWANCVCKALDGSIWFAGLSSMAGGEVDSNYGKQDAWFVHTDSAGNLLSAKVLGSHQQDEGTMVYPLSNGNIIGGGYYDTTGCSFPFISWGGGGSFLTIFAPWPESVQQINSINGIVKIYPNPVNELVTVEALQNDNYSVVITDVFGRTIYTSNFTEKVQIPVNGWQTGLYYVQVISENGFKTINKLLVE